MALFRRQPIPCDVDNLFAPPALRQVGKMVLLPLHANPASIKCGFNKINGDYACENHHLITEVLKGERGFKGFVMSDFNAIPNAQTGAWAFTDLDMPSGLQFTEANIWNYLCSIQRPMNVLDDKVCRNLRGLVNSGFDKGLTPLPRVIRPTARPLRWQWRGRHRHAENRPAKASTPVIAVRQVQHRGPVPFGFGLSYTSPTKSAADRPERDVKGFAKVFFKTGESNRLGSRSMPVRWRTGCKTRTRGISTSRTSRSASAARRTICR